MCTRGDGGVPYEVEAVPVLLYGNGVKQGEVISRFLFCIQTGSLMGALKNSGFGCYTGRAVYLVALAYDDRIMLLERPYTPGANAINAGNM